MVRAPTLARCLHPDKPHHCTEVTAQVSPQVLRFPPACPPPTPAAPTAQEGGPRPAAPVTFEPGAPRPSDPRASLSPLVPPPRVRGRGREESDAAGHLPFSPALPAAPRCSLAPPSAQEPRPPPPAPLQPQPLLPLPRLPGHPPGEGRRGGGDRSRRPNSNSRRAPSAREPTGPGLAPLDPHAPPQTPTP